MSDGLRSMGWRRWVLACLAVVNGLAALLAILMVAYGAPSPRRIAGLLFLLATVVALVVAIVSTRSARRPNLGAVLLLLPPLLISLALNDSLPLWWPDWAGGPILSSRIAEGPLPPEVRSNYGVPPSHLALLGDDGVSVSIRPSFGAVDYDLDLAPAGLGLPGRPTARLWVRHKGSAPREYRFHVPWEDLTVTLQAFDARARHWRGQRGAWTDGTSILVERVKDGRTVSIDTNASAGSEPGNPAAQLRTDLHALMLAYGPTGSIPRNYEWHVDRPEPGLACSERGLNTPEPKGAAKDARCYRGLSPL